MSVEPMLYVLLTNYYWIAMMAEEDSMKKWIQLMIRKDLMEYFKLQIKLKFNLKQVVIKFKLLQIIARGILHSDRGTDASRETKGPILLKL